MNTYDLLLDSLAGVVAMARVSEGVSSESDLIAGAECVCDAAWREHLITYSEWRDLLAVAWDMKGYRAVMFQDAF